MFKLAVVKSLLRDLLIITANFALICLITTILCGLVNLIVLFLRTILP